MRVIAAHRRPPAASCSAPAFSRLRDANVCLADGPQGFRGTTPGISTAWPSGLSVAASWSRETMFLWGQGMGEEFREHGANVQLGPGVCVARVPENGATSRFVHCASISSGTGPAPAALTHDMRVVQYLSGEDPHLGFTLVQPTIAAIQGAGVIANAKHFVANNQVRSDSALPALTYSYLSAVAC